MLQAGDHSIDATSCEICILAGGLSRRMGRDKTRLRLGRRTMLGVIRATAAATGLSVRVIRKDCVQRCGPLGGIYTALTRTAAQAVLFLACDMPFVSTELLQTLLTRWRSTARSQPDSSTAFFVRANGMVGFPFLLRREALPVVASQISRREFSLQNLAEALKAKFLRPSRHFASQFQNINTPEEWKEAARKR
jgi:molybdopterin-guanine dinucleotide biosynthesis protein A